MSLVAILLDLLAAGGYYVQLHSAGLYLVGAIFQGLLVVLLLGITFGYKGKKWGWFNYSTWAHNFTIRYAIIVFSLIGNALLLFLYILNLTGTNSLVFQ